MAPKTVKSHGTGKRLAVRRGPTPAEKLHHEFGVDHPTLARMLGLPERVLTEWENGNTVTPEGREKIRRVEEILRGLARVMNRDFIPTWLASPNEACGGRSPLDF